MVLMFYYSVSIRIHIFAPAECTTSSTVIARTSAAMMSSRDLKSMSDSIRCDSELVVVVVVRTPPLPILNSSNQHNNKKNNQY